MDPPPLRLSLRAIVRFSTDSKLAAAQIHETVILTLRMKDRLGLCEATS